MENTKQMQMNLVVNASKAMTTLNEVNDALALIGNTEKLKGLSQAFENVAQVISRARNFTEELDKTTAKVLGDVSKDAAKAQSEVAKAFESTSKQISSSVDKNAHDMGGLLALQDKLAKSASKLGQVYQEVAKSTDGAKLTPKVDEASARKEIAQLEGLYQKHYDKLLDMQVQYEDKYAKRYKTDGKGHKAGDYKLDKDGEPIIDYSKWYNSDRLSTVIGKLTDYQYRMAELEKQMGRTSSAKERISKFRNDLDTLNYVPSNDEIHFIPEGEHFTGSKAESIAKQLAERETNLFTNATNATKKANEEGRRKFEEEQAEERRKLEEQITNHVKKLMDIDPSKKFGKGQEWAKKLVPQIADRMIMGQKLLQGLTKEQLGIRPESMASDMRDLAVRIGQTFDVNGYNMAGKTIFDSATEDLKRAKVQLSNQDALVKDLEAKSKGIIERFNTRNKLIEDLSKKKQPKTKTEDTGSTENKPKKSKSPDTVISEFAEKLANAKASTVDLSKEFAMVAEAIPVGKADELVKKINEAKKALVQTLNAMVRATNPPKETSEPKKTKSKAKTKEEPVDPQIKETAKDLQHAKDNWDKVNSSIPAPAIGEAAANAKVLETALLAITTMDYSKMTSAMDSISKTSAAMVKALSTQVKGKEQKEQEQSKKEKKAKVETFKQQRAELISSMEKQFTANPEVVKTKGWADNISKLEELTGSIIRMRMELGQVNGVVGDFKQALTLATNPQVIQTLIAEMDKYYASLERVNEIIRQSKANTPMAQAAKNDKAIADADAAWDALERQKLNQMDNMWQDYHKSRQTEQEKLNKASEKQVSYYHALRDLEDRNQIKLITKEQTDALEKAQGLIKEYIKLKQKLDDTKVTGKEMSHGTFLKNARKEQEVIAKLKDKGIEAVSNYGSYDDYAKPLKQARAEEQAILELERKQTAEAKKHLQEIHKVVQQIREMRSVLALYKGENGDIMSLAGYNSKKAQLTNLTDKLYALTGERSIAKSIRDSELANLESVNRVSKVLPKDTTAMSELKVQITEAAVKAEQLYREFEKTGSIADKIRFRNAVKDLDELQKREDKINKALGATESWFGKIRNILEIRANWMWGGMGAGMLMNLPTDLLDAYRDLEQAMAGVQQVMPLIEGNQKETNAEAERFIGIAHEYARATDEVALAGQLWGRGYGKPVDVNYIKDEAQKAGIDDLTDSEAKYIAKAEAMKTTNELVAQSALLATVDNFSMEESVKGLESILSAYNMRAKSAAEATLFAGRAVDSITKVAHYGQISAQDLVQGIEATGKAAEQAGISLEFLEAMIETGVRNTGRSGSEIGQAVKALTVGIYSKKGVKELNNFGIDVTEMRNGVQVMRSAQSIILDISKALQDGKKNARDMLLAVSGGRYQYSKIASIVSDESEILRMWGEAVNSKGFAQEQLKVQMETLNAHIKQLKANFTSLIQEIMNSGAGDGVKFAIDTISNAVKVLTNNLDGAKTAVGLFVGAFAFKKLGNIVGYLSSMYKSFGEFQTELAKGGEKSSVGSILRDSIPAAKEKIKNQILGEQKTVLESLRASVEAETVAEGKNTIAKGLNNTATKGAVAGKTTQIVAEKALTTATDVATAAELRQAAVTTVATAGINLLIAGVIGAVTVMATYDSSLEQEEKRIESITGKTQDYIKERQDKEAVDQQEIATRKESVQYMDKAIEVYDRLKKANDDMVASKGEEAKADDTWKKNRAEMLEIEANFSDILGTDASKRIQESSDVKSAYTEEKNNYVKVTDEKVKALADMQKEVRKYYTDRALEFSQQKKVYDQDLENFGHWCDGQLEGLTGLAKLWAEFWELTWKNQSGASNIAGKNIADLEAKKMKALQDGDDDEFYRLKAEQDEERNAQKRAQNNAKWAEGLAKGGLHIAGFTIIEGINDKRAKLSSSEADALGKAHSENTIDPNAIKGYGVDTDDGEYQPPTGSSHGKKGGHHKTPVGFGDVREQVYHNMALDGVVVQAGFDENTIKALSQMINGEDSSNLFGLGESDVMMAGFKMAQEIKKAGTNGGIPAVLEALGIDKSRMDELTNNAKWYKDNLDWSRGGNEIFGASNGSDVASSMVADADAHLGEQWRGVDAGFDSNSTWEKQCASWVSYEMQKHGITSINSANGDVIMQQAGGAYKAGEAPLNAGDIINWASHVGIYDGNGGYIARNSSGGIHHGSMEEARQWFGNVLGRVDFNELAAQNGVNVGSKIPWVNSKAKQTIWNWEYDPKRHNSLMETQQNDLLEKKYQLELKEAEVQKQMYGETARYFGAVRNLEKQRLVNLTSYNEKFRVQFESNKKAFGNYINGNEGLQSVLKDRGVGSFFDLSDEEQKELMKRLADSGSNLDKEMEKVLSWLISNRNKVGENQIAVDQQKAKVSKIEGHMTPQEREDYDIAIENDRYELSKGWWDSSIDDREHYEKIASIYEARLARQQAELDAAHVDSENEQNNLLTQIDTLGNAIKESESKLNELKAKGNPTGADKAEIRRLNDDLSERKGELEETTQKYTDLKNNGSETERTLQQAVNKTARDIKAARNQAMAIEREVASSMKSGITSTFSNMLLEGQSFKEGWQSLWKSIAQIAIRQLLEVWLFQKVLGLGIGGLSTGGSVTAPQPGQGVIKGRANGGLIGFADGGFTDGLIKGAGTGTSDSILTYLAHRGQFIKTSNGEYIIQKSSVDKLGVPFLDMLNQNPDALKSMKKYADGGSLGTQMNPSMKMSTMESYHKYNANKMVTNQNQNKRLEELMQQQNDLISNMGKDGNEGGMVILNTQASSEQVMKALSENPRALNAILGRNRRMGFR